MQHQTTYPPPKEFDDENRTRRPSPAFPRTPRLADLPQLRLLGIRGLLELGARRLLVDKNRSVLPLHQLQQYGIIPNRYLSRPNSSTHHNASAQANGGGRPHCPPPPSARTANANRLAPCRSNSRFLYNELDGFRLYDTLTDPNQTTDLLYHADADTRTHWINAILASPALHQLIANGPHHDLFAAGLTCDIPPKPLP